MFCKDLSYSLRGTARTAPHERSDRSANDALERAADEIDRLFAALSKIATQKTTEEMDEFENERADFEAKVLVARAEKLK